LGGGRRKSNRNLSHVGRPPGLQLNSGPAEHNAIIYTTCSIAAFSKKRKEERKKEKMAKLRKNVKNEVTNLSFEVTDINDVSYTSTME
jgi:hypothetical protein